MQCCVLTVGFFLLAFPQFFPFLPSSLTNFGLFPVMLCAYFQHHSICFSSLNLFKEETNVVLILPVSGLLLATLLAFYYFSTFSCPFYGSGCCKQIISVTCLALWFLWIQTCSGPGVAQYRWSLNFCPGCGSFVKEPSPTLGASVQIADYCLIAAVLSNVSSWGSYLPFFMKT